MTKNLVFYKTVKPMNQSVYFTDYQFFLNTIHLTLALTMALMRQMILAALVLDDSSNSQENAEFIKQIFWIVSSKLFHAVSFNLDGQTDGRGDSNITSPPLFAVCKGIIIA